jgi:hypothetical protein
MIQYRQKYQQPIGSLDPCTNRSTTNDNDERLLDGFGTSELNFPEEFRLLGLFPANHDYDDNYHGQDDDWGDLEQSDNSDDHSWNSWSGDSDDDEGEKGLLGADYDGDADNDEHRVTSHHNRSIEIHPENNSVVDGENGGSEAEEFATNRPGKQAQDGAQTQNTVTTPFQRRKERMQRSKERKRREHREAQRRAMLDLLKAAEEELCSKYTTRELVMAQTLLQALEKKVQNVEELLENLQDEVWAAEEEAEAQSIANEGKGEMSNDDSADFSLLDQVLAMVLGALPMEPGHELQEHYQYIKKEHTEIVDQWKNYFGRLPPAASTGSTRSTSMDGLDSDEQNETMKKERCVHEQRKEFGIEDNDDEWDAGDDSD